MPYSTIVEMNAKQLSEAVAGKLRAERARVNLTLREAGEKAGVHYVSISRYEQGKLPTLDALFRLAEAYGVEVADLLPTSAAVADTPKRKK